MRWRDRAEQTSLASPAVVDFHYRFIERLWAGGHVDLIRGGSSDVAVGYLYNFVLCGKVFFFQSGFNYQEAASLSPGLLVHSMAIEYYRLRGAREYDFLAGDARYKRSLANRHRDLYWSIVYRDWWWIRWTLLARRIRAWLTGAKRAVREIVRASTPAEHAKCSTN